MRTRVVRCPGCGHCNYVRFEAQYARTAPTVDGRPGTLKELTPSDEYCWSCDQHLDMARLTDLTRSEIRAMSPEEYREAVLSGSGDYGEGLFVFAQIVWFGGWIPAGIVAVVGGIVVALSSGDWSQFLLIALGGTVLGYVAVMVAMPVSDDLDIRWLRTGNPDVAWFVILVAVGPAVALLVAVLVLVYGLGLDPTPVLDLVRAVLDPVLDHHLVVLPAIALAVWALRVIVEHDPGDERHPPLDD